LTTNYFSPLVKAGFIDVWGVKNPRYNLNDVDSFEPISVRMCRLSDLGKLWLEKGEIRF
jgi:hypothetical protein